MANEGPSENLLPMSEALRLCLRLKQQQVVPDSRHLFHRDISPPPIETMEVDEPPGESQIEAMFLPAACEERSAFAARALL
ncbi:hypothetical protein HPB48_006489 [Haemaphysalis longicornis]|uniref:Uncharacterized protein n=1 Tax=Haemaphysalis longicornis TaxID=44386 RepID=A0A9J6GK24_HAELO|nr:hypothetical protein HPB48_006489 [Haemaphysalis longicornis]